MKKLGLIFGFIGILGFVLASPVLAKGGMKWQGSGGWGKGGEYSRIYDPKTVETVKGEVVSVDQFTPKGKMSYGIHLTLKTEQETVTVHLGPSLYILKQDVKIEPKDQIEVKGSKVTYDGKPALIAAEVKKGDETMPLRDDAGIPVWAGWRKMR